MRGQLGPDPEEKAGENERCCKGVLKKNFKGLKRGAREGLSSFWEVFNTGGGGMETISERKAASGIATKVPLSRDPQPGPAAERSYRQFKTKSTFPTTPEPSPHANGPGAGGAQQLAEGRHSPAGRDELGDGKKHGATGGMFPPAAAGVSPRCASPIDSHEDEL